jgi:hypothetical protein
VPRIRAEIKPDVDIPPDEILEALLIQAGVAKKLPTDESRLLNFLRLEQMDFDFMHEIDFLNDESKSGGEIRAALHLAERVVATQSGVGEKRRRFSIFHEIAHCVLPEHNLNIFVDNDHTLSWWTKARLEREANRFAADLLFQGRMFSEQALEFDTSVQTVVDLAPRFGASYEAALRRYSEQHVMPCALIVFDKTGRSAESFVDEDEYRVQYTITSAPFRKAYFSNVRMSEDTCRSGEVSGKEGPLRVGEIVEKELIVRGDAKETWRFETEVFSNGYKVFQFLKRPLVSKGK